MEIKISKKLFYSVFRQFRVTLSRLGSLTRFFNGRRKLQLVGLIYQVFPNGS